MRHQVRAIIFRDGGARNVLLSRVFFQCVSLGDNASRIFPENNCFPCASISTWGSVSTAKKVDQPACLGEVAQ